MSSIRNLLSFSRRYCHTSIHSLLDSERMELLQKVEKGVLHVRCGGGTGTAFVVDKNEGCLMTAGHNVLQLLRGRYLNLRGDAHVTLPGSEGPCNALVSAVAPVRDLAILRVDPEYLSDAYEFSFGENLAVGSSIFSLGHGDAFKLLRAGMVSSAPIPWNRFSRRFRRLTSVVTSPAPKDFTLVNMDMGTARGSSGSPVFGLDGKVVGVVKCGSDDDLDLSTFYVPAQHVIEFMRLFRAGLLKMRKVGGVVCSIY